MDAVLEKKFTQIAEDAIRTAENVDCELPDFREGLRIMLDVLEERVDLENDQEH